MALDPARFSEVYEATYQRVRNYLYSRTSNPETADDLAQEVYLRAWKGWEHYEDRGVPVVAWLFRIAHNLVTDYHRREAIRQRLEAPILMDLPRTDYDTQDDIAARLDAVEGLRQLPIQQQRRLIAQGAGYPLREIATHEGVSRGTVSVTIWAGRKRLREGQW